MQNVEGSKIVSVYAPLVWIYTTGVPPESQKLSVAWFVVIFEPRLSPHLRAIRLDRA
jgi:hypothetical protein